MLMETQRKNKVLIISYIVNESIHELVNKIINSIKRARDEQCQLDILTNTHRYKRWMNEWWVCDCVCFNINK